MLKISLEMIVKEVLNNSLIPPFITIDGLADVVAEMILKERNKKQFDSVEDFKQRTPVNKTQFKKMSDIGAFNNIKIDNQQQLSLL